MFGTVLAKLATTSEQDLRVHHYLLRRAQRRLRGVASGKWGPIRQNLFLEDEYIRQQRPRSILCLPLVKQAKLMGVLYLENKLAPRVFTTKGLALLELLASQAAISLDHARLYADLIQENNDRRKAEEELRRKEASLREAQTELAHVSRVTTMGELAASIAHEVNQPLAGILTNANASLRWLAGDSPNLAEAREANAQHEFSFGGHRWCRAELDSPPIR